jgi:hypothetical protein
MATASTLPNCIRASDVPPRPPGPSFGAGQIREWKHRRQFLHAGENTSAIHRGSKINPSRLKDQLSGVEQNAEGSQRERYPQSGIDGVEIIEISKLLGNRLAEDCSKIVRHDNGIGSQTGMLGVNRLQRNINPARMSTSSEVAGNQSENDLGDSSFQMICLHNKGGTSLECTQIRI